MAIRKKAIGQRGSWFATIDGESYPCVHEHWFNRGLYDDPGLEPGEKRSEELVSAIREKEQVILTTGKVTPLPRGAAIERTGYIALWSVAEIEFDERGLRFRFKDRLAEL